MSKDISYCDSNTSSILPITLAVSDIEETPSREKGRALFLFSLRQVPDELDDVLRLPGWELAQEGLELAGLAGGF